ncbi:MAG: hypothetical protein E6Q76_16175 [Rhizobium sp.]|nr:MAG: hypothetical protein E6Q76_16175 [Rhizobium sp.]
MSLLKSVDAPRDLPLRDILQSWARKFVHSDLVAERIVERTISVLCEKPELLGDGQMNEELFALLRRHAFDENELRDTRLAEAIPPVFDRPRGEDDTVSP